MQLHRSLHYLLDMLSPEERHDFIHCAIPEREAALQLLKEKLAPAPLFFRSSPLGGKKTEKTPLECFRSLVQNYLRLSGVEYWHRLTQLPDYVVRELYLTYLEPHIGDAYLEDFRRLCESDQYERKLALEFASSSPEYGGIRRREILLYFGIDNMAMSWNEAYDIFCAQIISRLADDPYTEDKAWERFNVIPFPQDDDILAPATPPPATAARKRPRIDASLMAIGLETIRHETLNELFD